MQIFPLVYLPSLLFWLPYNHYFLQPRYFLKFLSLIFNFSLIWLDSGHISFHANFAPSLPSFCVVFTPEPPIFPATKVIFKIFLSPGTFLLIWFNFGHISFHANFAPSLPSFFVFMTPIHQYFLQLRYL